MQFQSIGGASRDFSSLTDVLLRLLPPFLLDDLGEGGGHEPREGRRLRVQFQLPRCQGLRVLKGVCSVGDG